MSVTLDSKVDREILSSALKNTMPRFPSFRYSVKNGLFWWFLQKLENDPAVGSYSELKPFNIRKNTGMAKANT